jgi:Uma2 family endonuclease
MTRIVATYQDYVALPDDGRRWEIHEGELVPAPPVGTRHQTVAAELLLQIARHVEDRRLGEVFPGPLDVILSDTTVVQPDIVFLTNERSHLVSERAIEGAPTLVVEILTPASTVIDRVTKPILYARHGVPFVWLVDPEGESFEAFELAGGGLSARRPRGRRGAGESSALRRAGPRATPTVASPLGVSDSRH